MPGHQRDLIAIVHSQLPAGIRDKLAVDISGDAYQLSVTAKFTDERKREWVCALETLEFEGIQLRCQIPAVFLAQLCAVV